MSLGLWLVTNSGYGTDASKNLLFYIFNYTEINEVYLHTLLRNIRAQKSFQKAGFENPKEIKKGRYEFIKMSTKRDIWMNKFSDLVLNTTLEEEQD